MEYFGLNAALSTFIVVIFGYSAQVRLLYQKKKEAAKGVSLTLFGLTVYMLLSWVAYGFYGFAEEGINWYIFSCNTLGTILAVVIVCQIIYYRYFYKEK